MRKPDFDNLLKVLKKERPDRATLFELFLNSELYLKLTGVKVHDAVSSAQNIIDAFAAAGYDYATLVVPEFRFNTRERERAASVSLNDGAVILDEADFEKYSWPEFHREKFDRLKDFRVPHGMKLVALAPNGILENVIGLMGYDNLCINLFDNRDLVRRIFDKVGETLLNYYDWCLDYECFGAAICNDDWGFNSMPMLDPASMREFVIPWTAKFNALIHSKGRPVIQHSCGNLYECGLIEDVIEVCKFDAHHSFEDKILPVEKAYEQYHRRIAIIGGIDIDFLCRATPDEITRRSSEMLDRAEAEGSYALGSGNSIPEYVPMENYFAMTRAALER